MCLRAGTGVPPDASPSLHFWHWHMQTRAGEPGVLQCVLPWQRRGQSVGKSGRSDPPYRSAGISATVEPCQPMSAEDVSSFSLVSAWENCTEQTGYSLLWWARRKWMLLQAFFPTLTRTVDIWHDVNNSSPNPKSCTYYFWHVSKGSELQGRTEKVGAKIALRVCFWPDQESCLQDFQLSGRPCLDLLLTSLGNSQIIWSQRWI